MTGREGDKRNISYKRGVGYCKSWLGRERDTYHIRGGLYILTVDWERVREIHNILEGCLFILTVDWERDTYHKCFLL